jgi:hypothetical protein
MSRNALRDISLYSVALCVCVCYHIVKHSFGDGFQNLVSMLVLVQRILLQHTVPNMSVHQLVIFKRKDNRLTGQ